MERENVRKITKSSPRYTTAYFRCGFRASSCAIQWVLSARCIYKWYTNLERGRVGRKRNREKEEKWGEREGRERKRERKSRGEKRKENGSRGFYEGSGRAGKDGIIAEPWCKNARCSNAHNSGMINHGFVANARSFQAWKNVALRGRDTTDGTT